MEIYTYRTDVYATSSDPGRVPDVTGWKVEASDGHIGKVDEATYETSSSCLVVDTGFWIFGKKRMIPAGVVQQIDADNQTVRVGMTKDQIREAPDYDPDRHREDKDSYHRDVGQYYDSYANRPSVR